MSKSKRDVVVYDTEYKNAAAYINNYCGALVEMIDEYVSSLDIITQCAIQDQKISAKIRLMAERVEKLREPIEEIAKQTEKNCKNFVAEIDSADQFLY